MHLDTQQQSNLQQDTLQLPDRDVIDRTGAELTVELFRSERFEIGDQKWPQM